MKPNVLFGIAIASYEEVLLRSMANSMKNVEMRRSNSSVSIILFVGAHLHLHRSFHSTNHKAKGSTFTLRPH
jgi:hypothetical protein